MVHLSEIYILKEKECGHFTGILQGGFFTGSTPKSSMCESGPIQQQDVN